MPIIDRSRPVPRPAQHTPHGDVLDTTAVHQSVDDNTVLQPNGQHRVPNRRDRRAFQAATGQPFPFPAVNKIGNVRLTTGAVDHPAAGTHARAWLPAGELGLILEGLIALASGTTRLDREATLELAPSLSHEIAEPHIRQQAAELSQAMSRLLEIVYSGKAVAIVVCPDQQQASDFDLVAPSRRPKP